MELFMFCFRVPPFEPVFAGAGARLNGPGCLLGRLIAENAETGSPSLLN